jgi:hypothetical protein
MFEGLGDQSFRTASSLTALSPFIRLDPFGAEARHTANEIAADGKTSEEEDWSDVSV